MDDNIILDRIRADADQFDAGQTDIDALVQGALRQGHRRRARRRVAGGISGAVAAALVVTVVVTGVPTGLHSGPIATPAAPAPGVSSRQDPTSTVSSRSTKSSATAEVGRVSGSPADVRRTLTGLLPRSLRVAHASDSRDVGSDGFAWEHTAAVTVRDAKGTAYLFGGVGDGAYSDGCFNLDDCERYDLAGGGTLWITRGPSRDKTGIDRTFHYNRPDGGHVWFSERNYDGGNDPISRPGLPLTDAVGRTLVTSSAWDALFAG